MPVINSSAKASVGRDVSLVLLMGTGTGVTTRVDMPNVTDFDAKQEKTKLKSNRLDGVIMRAALPMGWNGSFGLERGSNALENVIAVEETAWYTTGLYMTGMLYQYITETDGSTTTYVFDNVTITLGNAGTWKGDAFVKQTLEFEAGRRRQV
jgi:hypothetical protein